LSWIQYLSPIKYAYLALCQNEFTGLKFSQPMNSGYSTGEQVLLAMDLKILSISECCLLLFALTFLFLALALAGLYLSTKPNINLLSIPKKKRFSLFNYN